MKLDLGVSNSILPLPQALNAIKHYIHPTYNEITHLYIISPANSMWIMQNYKIEKIIKKKKAGTGHACMHDIDSMSLEFQHIKEDKRAHI